MLIKRVLPVNRRHRMSLVRSVPPNCSLEYASQKIDFLVARWPTCLFNFFQRRRRFPYITVVFSEIGLVTTTPQHPWHCRI